MSSPVTAQLFLIAGESENFQQVIDLHSVNRSIGRAQNCDIIWGSLQISRKHATLEYMLPKWYIRDLSTNGLSVNGSKLVKGELSPLNDNDIISFIPTGSVRYRFRYLYNSSPRNTSGNLASSTNFLGISSAPQPSTSRSAIGSSSSPATSTSREVQNEARGRPSVEVIGSDSHSDSEDSNHSESLLSLDPPDADFLSFSADEQDHAEADAPSPRSVAHDDSDDNSFEAFASKRKHGGSDSDSNSLDRKKKKRLQFPESSDDDESRGSSNIEKSDVPSSSCSRFKNIRIPDLAGFLTDDQIADCSDLGTLKVQLRQCLTKLARTEVKLQTVECERVMEKEEYSRKATDVESVTAAIKEENYKKILELVESELSCAVCNEIFIQATVVDCGHTFCSFCICEWSKKKQECPICRKPFRNRSRHIELENFVTRMFESFNEEIASRRKASIKDREEQIQKAAEAARVVPIPGRPGVNNANFHTFMQRTAETYVDFLAELHQFNELLGPNTNRSTGRGTRDSANAAADRRRSARIQDRVIDAVATGAAGPAPPSRAGTARRGRGTGSRTRAVLNAPAPPPPGPGGFLPLLEPPPTARNPIPVVNLDDSSNGGGNGNPAQPLRFSNQLLNYMPIGISIPANAFVGMNLLNGNP